MKKAGNFFRSILPFLVVLLLNVIVTIPMEIIYTIRYASQNGEGMDGILNTIQSSVQDPAFMQITNFVYGILAVIVFVYWYRRVFVTPFSKKKNSYPTGYSFHTILAILFLGVGMQYVTTLAVKIISAARPDWMESYVSMMERAGFSEVTVILFLYSVILAPIVEETIFRGLIFRYARLALPFWFANIWQALLFGVLHMNFVQGIYAFLLGLILGFIAHRGRGIRYSIPVHIVFNFIGTMYPELISFTNDFTHNLSIAAGIALTVFALWLFYTDFIPANPRRVSRTDQPPVSRPSRQDQPRPRYDSDSRRERTEQRYDIPDRQYDAPDRQYDSSDRRYSSSDRRYTSSDRRYTSSDRRYTSSDQRYGSSNPEREEQDSLPDIDIEKYLYDDED